MIRSGKDVTPATLRLADRLAEFCNNVQAKAARALQRRCAPLSRSLRGRVGVGALAALGFAERAPTRLALLGTLPRKREREESYADGAPPLPRLSL